MGGNPRYCTSRHPEKLGIKLTIHHVTISRVQDQTGLSRACYIVEVYHPGPEPSNFTDTGPTSPSTGP